MTQLKTVSTTVVAGDLFGGEDTRKLLASTHTTEIVIALCGPIGSPLHDVADKLRETLTGTFAYDGCEIIRLSRFIENHAAQSKRNVRQSGHHRLTDLINIGNEMRGRFGAGILAELAVRNIRIDRETNGKDASGRYVVRRVAHIIDSIKNQQELDLLRTVYREALYVVGVFAPLTLRVAALQNMGLTEPQIADLINRDSGEEMAQGQTVTDTFPQSDFFLRMEHNTETQLRHRVERFLHLILGTQVITPTRAETAMYSAASAAGNSACLSRQVGAAVTDQDGEVLAIGWNDVPKPFGDLYVTDEADPSGDKDKRCWNHGGKCYNDEEKKLFANHLVEALGDLIPFDKRVAATESIERNKKLRGLIEFSRSIHAEMHALLTALRQTGGRVRGGKIYITTYPCHSCARHIIAAGIKEVYYIEPYKKSLATKLHGDAMSEVEQDESKVRVIPYDGVAPTRYLSLFRMQGDTRKLNGRVIRIAPSNASPKLEKSLEALPALEALVVNSLIERNLEDLGAHRVER